MSWALERAIGAAAAFHARPIPEPAVRAVWVHEVERPALVLGSAQADTVVDRAAAAAAGVEVVRRRSGGGVVLLGPGDVLWVDVIVPAADPWWEPDVGRSAWWLGDVWSRALAGLGVEGVVHHDRPRRSAWSDLVCFAGLASGEVTVAGRKVVGISQRRTRQAARFQCAALLRWDAVGTAALLAVPDRAALTAAVEPLASGLDVVADRLEQAFLAALG